MIPMYVYGKGTHAPHQVSLPAQTRALARAAHQLLQGLDLLPLRCKRRALLLRQTLLLCNLLLLSLELFLLSFNLRLLFFDGVDQHDADALVLNSLDLAFPIVGDKERLDLLNVLCTEAEIVHASFFPVKCNRPKLVYHFKAESEIHDVCLISKRGRATGEL